MLGQRASAILRLLHTTEVLPKWLDQFTLLAVHEGTCFSIPCQLSFDNKHMSFHYIWGCPRYWGDTVSVAGQALMDFTLKE